MRSHYWGSVLMIVVTGDLNDENSLVLGSSIRKLQREADVIVDLWDATSIDSVATAALEAGKRRADSAGWGFAVVADPAGPIWEQLEAQGALIRPFASRQAARAAFQTAPS